MPQALYNSMALYLRRFADGALGHGGFLFPNRRSLLRIRSEAA